MGFFKNRKLRKRLGAGLLALCMVTMTPLAVSAETVAEIQAEQDRLEAEKQELQSKLDQLRKLDKSAAKKGTVVSVTVGVLGALVLGLGMCCTMVWVELFAPGIVIGLAGIALVAAAYPIYRRVTRREREKLAPQILKLTEELQKP